MSRRDGTNDGSAIAKSEAEDRLFDDAPAPRIQRGVMRVCATCKRACHGSAERPEAFGAVLSQDAQSAASRIVLLTHTICVDCDAKSNVTEPVKP